MVKKGRGDVPNERRKKTMLAGAPPRGGEEENRPGIDRRVQREIGRHLRAQYDDVANEPVPDRFLELLKRLEQSVEEDQA